VVGGIRRIEPHGLPERGLGLGQPVQGEQGPAEVGLVAGPVRAEPHRFPQLGPGLGRAVQPVQDPAEMFYESDCVLPHREAAWILLTERLRQAAEYCEPDGPCAPAVADGLDAVRSSLSGIARSLEAHLPARDLPTGTPAPAVPDQRNAYPGEQVTIFDNRGICQHSGLCTDQLATAFRTKQEPFVAPSGARMDELIRAVRDCPSGR
jgi:uncharacterized Fe-S cluster protein YjdI